MQKTKNSAPSYSSLMRKCDSLQREVSKMKRQHELDLSEIVMLRRQMERMKENDTQRKKD